MSTVESMQRHLEWTTRSERENQMQHSCLPLKRHSSRMHVDTVRGKIAKNGSLFDGLSATRARSPLHLEGPQGLCTYIRRNLQLSRGLNKFQAPILPMSIYAAKISQYQTRDSAFSCENNQILVLLLLSIDPWARLPFASSLQFAFTTAPKALSGVY